MTAVDARPADTPAQAGPPTRSRRALVIAEHWLGSNAFAGLKALRRAGWAAHEVAQWEYIPVRWLSPGLRLAARLLRRAAVAEFNRELVRQADRLRPEFLLVFKGPFVAADALRALRSMGVRSYLFYPDVSFRVHGPWLPEAIPEFDWVFTTKSFGLRDLRDQLGVTRGSLVMHAFDPELHRPVELAACDRDRYGCDVSFIGTWSPKKERVLSELRRRRPSVRLRVWGEQWFKASPSSGLAGVIGGHEVTGEEYIRAIQASAINLGILSEQRPGASDGDRITSRTFHIPACGGFMLHERTDELLALFDEDAEVACFDGVDELCAQVDRFLADDALRRRVAERGRARVSNRDSWDHRIAEILGKHAEFSA